MTARARSAVLIVALAGCAPAGLTPTQFPTVTFAGPPVVMDAVACDTLLSEAEIAEALGQAYAGTGRVASSCYWSAADGSLVQLVFQTGDTVLRWREELLRTYAEFIGVAEGVELWGEPGDDSIAAFGPGRGLIMHGVGDRDGVVELLLMALARL